MRDVVIDRLSNEDARILRLGRGAIRGHTCKVIVLEAGESGRLPSLEALRAHIAARLDGAPRLRQRVVTTPLRVANPVWLDDPAFEIAHHVVAVPAPGEVSEGELQRIVAQLMAERLDRSRPLWRLDVVENLERDRMALIWRVHHCLADGTTSMRVASTVFWDQGEAVVPGGPWRPQASPSTASLLVSGLAARANVWPRRPRSAPLSVAARRLSSAVARRELRRSASLTALAGRAGSRRSVAFFSVPLERCRIVGKSIGESVTVNDVVLAIIAGAVRAWLTPASAVRVKVPVSLHQRDEPELVSNRNSYFFVDLPVSEPDAAQRVLLINRETRERKLHHDAEVLYRLGAHPFVSHWAMSPRVFTFNVSNVRGPTGEVFMCGARVQRLYSLAEIAKHHALRIAVISAADSLFFGLCADAAAVVDLDVLVDGLRRASEELLTLRA